MTESFGRLQDGTQATLYTISCGGVTAKLTDFGAHLVSLLVPDKNGNLADVVLGYDDAEGYRTGGGTYFGAIVGRNANRVKDSTFMLGDTRIRLTPNEGVHCLHGGPEGFHLRMWETLRHSDTSITFRLVSPKGDQGYPGTAVIDVTYTMEPGGALRITYDAVSDRDTVFNLTNHSYFNLAGHDKPELAMDQLLAMPARFFCPDDVESIPTGELRSVAGTPMDFREPKPIGRDIEAPYDALDYQGGYDHNFEVFCNPCAIVIDPHSGREMTVSTDCPGIQFYAGNYLNEPGKNGVHYVKRGGIALETQFFPDAVHHPDWKQPITKADERYHSETVYAFKW